VAREFVVIKELQNSKKNWYKLKLKQKRTGIQFQLWLLMRMMNIILHGFDNSKSC
jgi:hypothetical protein